MYHNYHKHDHYGNPWTIDVIVKPEEYCKRAVELGHNSVFTVNHGVTGNIFEWLKVSKEYNLKLCYGTEAYYVQDRFEKDRSNRHIIIIAKNDDGIMQLNDIMSEAHMTGFYYKPRIDSDLLFSLDHNNFIITTACIKGIWNDTELVLALKRKFGKNFFLELQCHNAGFQKDLNTQLLNLSKQEHIPIIHANDSHYIYPEDSKYRDIFLKGKGMDYQDENEMILDYPSEEEIYQRYEKQGILTRDQVTEALNNTMVFDECEKITLINDDIKLPSISNTPMEDLKQIVRERWKEERKQIPKSEWKKYTDAIIYELDIIEKTKMANYFLIDYNIVKNAQEKYGGRLTKTGRGSAPSFYVTKMLGLTDIDRVSAPITLFPTRFMSIERILGSRSLPDIDLNTADRVPFIKATEDLLGKENCAWMLAWKPLQNSSAFRLYCKGIGLSIKEYDEIAKNLELYENDPKWKNTIKESKRFIGVIESISESPCSMLLYNKPVRKEIGLVRTNNDVYCCLLDGINCDSYKYLKNDYLSVTIWAIIRDVCELANISIPTIREINSLLDNKTFDIYEKGLTCTINQADSEYATPLVKRYNPQSVSEMSAFVAIIRPGCASLLQDFIDRKPYTTGIEELDEILVEGNHRMIYQELIMKYLIWLGIPETGSYDIIKKIAKKKFKEPELIELKSKLLNGWINRVGKKEGFEETWAVVQDAAKYSFNASHSLSYAYDSLYGAYLKSHYPLEYYTVALNYYRGDMTRTSKLKDELEYWGIKLVPIKFRKSQSQYSLSKEENYIYQGISSIKNCNETIAGELYALRDNSYDTFVDLLYDIKEKTSVNSKQLRILIKLDFFTEFGEPNHLLNIYKNFESLGKISQLKKDKIAELGISPDIIKKYATKETEKMFVGINVKSLLKQISDMQSIASKKQSLKDKVKAQIEYLGYINIVDERYKGILAVLEINTTYSPKLKVYSLKNGTVLDMKIDKRTYNSCKLETGDIIKISGFTKKPKVKRNEDGKFEPIAGTSEMWITKYTKLEDI
jgi:DNA polymerase III alpha subunit